MSHWIIMNVTHEILKLFLALDGVLPEPALPDVALSLPVPRPADVGAGHASAWERAGEQHLHPADSA